MCLALGHFEGASGFEAEDHVLVNFSSAENKTGLVSRRSPLFLLTGSWLTGLSLF